MTYFLLVLLVAFSVGYFEQRKQARRWEANWKYCKHLKDLLEMQLSKEQKEKFLRTVENETDRGKKI